MAAESKKKVGGARGGCEERSWEAKEESRIVDSWRRTCHPHMNREQPEKILNREPPSKQTNHRKPNPESNR